MIGTTTRHRRPAALLGRAALMLALLAGPTASAAQSYRVVVKSWPAGARVSVDAKGQWLAGVTPLTVELARGEHLLFGELAGHRPLERLVDITAEQTVFLRFEPLAGAAPPQPSAPPAPDVVPVPDPGDPGPPPLPPAPVGEGTLTVAAAQPLDVIAVVDDVEVGPAPWTGPVAAGPHVISVRGLGYEGRPQEITVVANEALTTLVEVDEVAYLTVRANVAGARVVVGGEDIGVTPLDRAPIPLTATTVAVHKRGYFKFMRKLAPKPAYLLVVEVTLKRAGPRAIAKARQARARKQRLLAKRKQRRRDRLGISADGTYRVVKTKPLKWLEITGHSLWVATFAVNVGYAIGEEAPGGAFIPFAGPAVGLFSNRGDPGAWALMGVLEWAGLAMGLVGGLITRTERVPIERRRRAPGPEPGPTVTVVPVVSPAMVGVGLTLTEF